MGDHQDGGAQLPVHQREGLHQTFGVCAVQCAGGLIRQDQGGLCDQRPGAGRALPLSAGELPGELGKLIPDLEGIGHSQQPLPGFSGRPLLQVQGQDDVLRHRQRIQQVVFLEDEPQTVTAEGRQLLFPHLGNTLSFQKDPAGAGAVNGGNDVQKRALPGAGGAHNSGEFSPLHPEAHPIEGLGDRLSAAVVFGDIVDLK